MRSENKHGSQDNSIYITNGVEIKVGQTVPILQHWQCIGTQGTVVSINTDYNSYQINCNNCGKRTTLDIKTLTTKAV